MSLVLRNVKGSPLTYTEMDENLIYLESLGAVDLEVDVTPVINGADKSIFYNDNGVFSETNLTYETKNGYEVLTGNGVDGGFFAGLVEFSPSISLPYVGLTGYPNISGTQYLNGVLDGSGIGQPSRSINGWADLGSGTGTFVLIRDNGIININAEGGIGINAEEYIGINAREFVNIDTEEYISIYAKNSAYIATAGNVDISASGDYSNLWANFGNKNSPYTTITFTNHSVDGKFVFQSGNGTFTIVDRRVSWDEKFRVDMINDLTTLSTGFKLGTNAVFGQQFQTGQGHTVDDLITVLQNMGILTQ